MDLLRQFPGSETRALETFAKEAFPIRTENCVFDLTGKVILVTGAGQNVGAGIARTVALRGASVVVNDYHTDRAEHTVNEIRSAGGIAVASVFDVTDREAVNAAFERI